MCRLADDDFADPPDMRFPGQFEDVRRLDMDLSRLARDNFKSSRPKPESATSEPMNSDTIEVK